MSQILAALAEITTVLVVISALVLVLTLVTIWLDRSV